MSGSFPCILPMHKSVFQTHIPFIPYLQVSHLLIHGSYLDPSSDFPSFSAAPIRYDPIQTNPQVLAVQIPSFFFKKKKQNNKRASTQLTLHLAALNSPHITTPHLLPLSNQLPTQPSSSTPNPLKPTPHPSHPTPHLNSHQVIAILPPIIPPHNHHSIQPPFPPPPSPPPPTLLHAPQHNTNIPQQTT